MFKGRYQVDLSDRAERIMFPVDFTTWLKANGRDHDAREFADRVQRYRREVSDEDYRMETVIRIAHDYALVHDRSEVEDPRAEAIRLLSAVGLGGSTDEVTSTPWNREDEAIRQAENDAPEPVDMDRPEFPDAHVILEPADTMIELAAKTVMSLMANNYPAGAKQFALDVRALLRWSESGEDLFHLIWSYVTVVPAHELAEPLWAA